MAHLVKKTRVTPDVFSVDVRSQDYGVSGYELHQVWIDADGRNVHIASFGNLPQAEEYAAAARKRIAAGRGFVKLLFDDGNASIHYLHSDAEPSGWSADHGL